MGAYCQLPFDTCAKNPSPCLNNGTCLHKTSSLKEYYCLCSQGIIYFLIRLTSNYLFLLIFHIGYEGKNCEINVNECLIATCPLGRVCIDGINSYECKCPEGYTGENCSKLLIDCQDRPCKNNATCIENSDGYTCRCIYGFTGTVNNY